MGKRDILERLEKIDGILKSLSRPINKYDLARRMEVDVRTIERDIQKMRYTYDMPVLIEKEVGYFYDEEGKGTAFSRINQKLSESEIRSLVMAYRLSVTIPHQRVKENIRQVFEKISRFVDFDLMELEHKITLKNVRFYKVMPEVFDNVICGLRYSRKLTFDYLSPRRKQQTTRTVSPLHLIVYMGNWHLFGFCEEKKDYRVFTLSRIKKVIVEKLKVNNVLSSGEIKEMIHRTYGIFLGDKKQMVTLVFSPQVHGIVKDQVWAMDQEMTEKKSGEIVLSFYVSDYTEIKKDILSFGEHVKVLEPKELQESVRETISKMNKIY